jgi:TetR/AcrR family transcriptional repressor of nem operon
MPWPKDHKARTREKIVQAAAAAFRAGGVAGVRVEDIMGRAGLTHGGFYAHFASKENLLREAVAHASEQTVDMLSKPLAGVRAEDRLQVVIDAYLSPAHAAHPEWGCPLATLGPELARTGGAPHTTLAEGLGGRLAWMRQLVPEDQRSALSDAQVIGTLACMVGGLVLARTVAEKDSRAVLDACRGFLRTQSVRSPTRARARRTKTRRPQPTAAAPKNARTDRRGR